MPVVGVVTLVAWCTGVYYANDNGSDDNGATDDGQAAYQWEAAYPYLSFVQLVSQGWAIYCLVMFYHAICGRLAAINPLAKLVAIKGIVFVTWAQEVGIGALQTVGFIRPIGEWDASAVFPKWAKKYPQPPDLIGVTRTYERAVDEPVLRAVQALQRSVPTEHKDNLRQELRPLGWAGFKMAGLTPNMTRRAQVSQWLLY